MNVEDVRDYALLKNGVEESFPFGNDTLVCKVDHKIFLLLSLVRLPHRFNVKCVPELAIEQREQYPEIIVPGYHMNKKHWNTVFFEQLPAKLVKQLIDDIYLLVQKPAKSKKKK